MPPAALATGNDCFQWSGRALSREWRPSGGVPVQSSSSAAMDNEYPMAPETSTDTLRAYAQGLFPMDDADAPDDPLPFYTADPRCVLDVSPEGISRLRHRLRRSLRRPEAQGWEPDVDRAFEAVLAACMDRPADGEWITPRLAGLYRDLHDAGFAHSFELWDDSELIAGVLGVVIGRAAMLESMFHRISHAGNVNLVRTLEALAAGDVVLCDIQLPTEHTLRIGAQLIPAAEYTDRLAAALAPRL